MANRILPGSGARDPRPVVRKPKTPKSKGLTPNGAKPKPNNNSSQGGQGGRHPAANGAMASANAQIRAGVNDARKERRMVRREAGTARRAAKRDYRQTLGDLDYIYGETGDYMNNMGQQIQQQYADQTSRAEAAQAALVQQLSQQSANVADGLDTELGRLGLQGVDNSQFASDSLNALTTAKQTGANTLANINAQSQGANSISALLQGMVQGSRVAGYGSAQNALQDNLFEIYENKREGYNQVREAISDLRGTRKDLVAQQLQQLGSGHWGRYLRNNHSSGGSSGGSQYSSYAGQSGGSQPPPSSGGKSGGKFVKPHGSDINSLLLGGITRRRR